MGRRRDFDKVIKGLFLLGCGLILAFFLYGELCLPKDDLFYVGNAKKYPGQWELCTSSGTKQIETPYQLGGKKGETAVVQTVLPEELEDNLVLCFLAVHQEMRFYINGELRQSYDNDDGLFFTDYAVRAYVPLDLSREDRGALLKVEITGWGSEGIGTFFSVYLGTVDQVLTWIQGIHLPRVVMASTLILIAAIVWIICMVLGWTLRRKIPMTWLCVTVIMLMVWLLADSAMRQFILPNTAAAANVAYLVMLLAPAAFGTYLDLVQKQRYHRTYQVMEGISCGVFFVCFVLNMTGVDFVDMSGVVYYSLLIMVTVCGLNLFREVFSGHIGEYWMVAVGIAITILCGIVEIVMLLLHMDKARQLSLCLSQLLFVVMAGFQTVSDIRQSIQAEKKKAAEADRVKEELAETLPAELLPLMRSLDQEIHQLEGRLERDQSESLKAGMNRALSFLTSIRDLSSIQRDTDFDEQTDYDLEEFTQSAQSFLDVRTKGRGLEGVLVVDSDIPLRMRGALESNKFIFINLVEYAVQRTASGVVTCGIGAVSRTEGFWMELSVASAGEGPTGEFRDNLENTDPELPIRGDIRLLSVRSMALRQGGRLVVESQEGAGFLIEVFLPHTALERASGALLKGSGEEKERETAETAEAAEMEEEAKAAEAAEAAEMEEEAEAAEAAEMEEEAKAAEAAEMEEEAEAAEAAEMEEAKKEPLPEEVAPETEAGGEKPEHLISTEAGLVYCRGSRQLYEEILSVYLEEGQEQQKKLQEYVEREDWENYRILVHGIKSTSLNIGAKSLGALAKEQEMAAREGQKDALLEGWRPLLELHSQVLQEIRGLLPEKEEEKEDPLGGVRECLEGYDMDAALLEVGRLKETGALPQELLEELKAAIEDFDYDRALALLDKSGL